MLASLADLGYEVEWRVINAANYGFPQKRRRVFIVGRLGASDVGPVGPDGVVGRARASVPGAPRRAFDWAPITLDRDVKVVSDTFGVGPQTSAFGNAGVMRICGTSARRVVWTTDVDAVYAGPHETLGGRARGRGRRPRAVLRRATRSSRSGSSSREAKSLSRISKATGLEYTYDEGADPVPRPDRHSVPDHPDRRRRGDTVTVQAHHQDRGWPVPTADAPRTRATEWLSGRLDRRDVGRQARVHDGQRTRGRRCRMGRERADQEMSAATPRSSAGRRGELRLAVAGSPAAEPAAEQSGRSQRHARQPGRDTGPELRLRRALREADLGGYRAQLAEGAGTARHRVPGPADRDLRPRLLLAPLPALLPEPPKSNPEFWAAQVRAQPRARRAEAGRPGAVGWVVIEAWECDVRDRLDSVTELSVLRALLADDPLDVVGDSTRSILRMTSKPPGAILRSRALRLSVGRG